MSLRITVKWAGVILSAMFLIGCTENPVEQVEEKVDVDPLPYDYIVPDLSEDIIIGYDQAVYVESEALMIRFSDVDWC